LVIITWQTQQIVIEEGVFMDAKSFLKTLSSTLTDWNPTAVSRMAQAQGYHFSADELETAADELWGNLSEDQLRDVAGGGSTVTPGPVKADTTAAGQPSSSGTWTPPPGDVSGNSCFFTKR
jgi:hypothetical protein